MGQSDSGHVWEMIKDSHFALLITHDYSGMDARPMAATARQEEGAIYILANKDEDSDRQIRLDGDTVLSFQNGASFVVVYGRAPLKTARRSARSGTRQGLVGWAGGSTHPPDHGHTEPGRILGKPRQADHLCRHAGQRRHRQAASSMGSLA